MKPETLKKRELAKETRKKLQEVTKSITTVISNAYVSLTLPDKITITLDSYSHVSLTYSDLTKLSGLFNTKDIEIGFDIINERGCSCCSSTETSTVIEMNHCKF